MSKKSKQKYQNTVSNNAATESQEVVENGVVESVDEEQVTATQNPDQPETPETEGGGQDTLVTDEVIETTDKVVSTDEVFDGTYPVDADTEVVEQDVVVVEDLDVVVDDDAEITDEVLAELEEIVQDVESNLVDPVPETRTEAEVVKDLTKPVKQEIPLPEGVQVPPEPVEPVARQELVLPPTARIEPIKPIVEEAPAPNPKESTDIDSSNFSHVGQRVLGILSNYQDVMAPRKPVSDEQINNQQKLLFEAMVKTINDSGEDFEPLMKRVLRWFEDNRAGVCHEARLYRGMDNIQLSKNDRTAFMRLLNMFKLLSNGQYRQVAIKQIDMVATLQYAITDTGRNRVMAFFGLN